LAVTGISVLGIWVQEVILRHYVTITILLADDFNSIGDMVVEFHQYADH